MSPMCQEPDALPKYNGNPSQHNGSVALEKGGGGKRYKVFEHPENRVEAVKQGWSWPAFFFIWIWALVKKMWVLG